MVTNFFQILLISFLVKLLILFCDYSQELQAIKALKDTERVYGKVFIVDQCKFRLELVRDIDDDEYDERDEYNV